MDPAFRLEHAASAGVLEHQCQVGGGEPLAQLGGETVHPIQSRFSIERRAGIGSQHRRRLGIDLGQRFARVHGTHAPPGRYSTPAATTRSGSRDSTSTAQRPRPVASAKWPSAASAQPGLTCTPGDNRWTTGASAASMPSSCSGRDPFRSARRRRRPRPSDHRDRRRRR